MDMPPKALTLCSTFPACHSGAAFSKQHLAILERVVYLAPILYEARFTSMANSDNNLATLHNPFAPLA
jgi:glutamate-1-semialdehyde aminotransferase